MKKSIKVLIIAVYLGILTILIIIWTVKKNKRSAEIVTLPEKYEIIAVADSIISKQHLNSCKYRAVCVLDDTILWELKDWIPYIRKYKEFPFVFYIKTRDKDTILEQLKQMDFPVPVFVVRKNKKDENPRRILMVGYILDKKNRIMELVNPLIPEYSSMLRKYNLLNKKCHYRIK